MGLPLFDISSDPGPSFSAFLTASNMTTPTRTSASEELAHATTVVAIKCTQGVVMVGDRQATSSQIAMRDVKKIAAADRFTAIAISGSAAMGLDFIRLAQLSFEHYEKMTSTVLSLSGKANYLVPMIRNNNLSTPFYIVPLLAGFDLSHETGRIFDYDGAGGCYEKTDFGVIGSGTPFAESTLRLGFRADLSLEEAIDLAVLAIYEAADNDPSTGGPDFVRGIFPMIVTITSEGFRELSSDESAIRFRAISDRRTASGGHAGGSLR
ncbi:MAG: proteasome subunit beta [Actinomycetota bacterium]|jgi:proteasome beta subunit